MTHVPDLPDPIAFRSLPLAPAAVREDDFGTLDLHRRVVRHPAATFFMVADRDVALAGGIRRGDLLVVDRSLTPRSDDAVVAVEGGDLRLRAASSLDRGVPAELWGVIAAVVRERQP